MRWLKRSAAIRRVFEKLYNRGAIVRYLALNTQYKNKSQKITLKRCSTYLSLITTHTYQHDAHTSVVTLSHDAIAHHSLPYDLARDAMRGPQLLERAHPLCIEV